MNTAFYYLSQMALPVANIVLLAAAVVALVRVQRVLRGTAIYSKLAAGTAIEAEIALLSESGRRVSSQLAKLQDRLESLAVLERLLEEPVARGLPMERATNLARSGASVDELTRSCGLSIGEARLMRRLHSGSMALQSGRS